MNIPSIKYSNETESFLAVKTAVITEHLELNHDDELMAHKVDVFGGSALKEEQVLYVACRRKQLRPYLLDSRPLAV